MLRRKIDMQRRTSEFGQWLPLAARRSDKADIRTASPPRNLLDVLWKHLGRVNGLFEPLFVDYGCNPYLAIVSDKQKAHQSQETVPYYRGKTKDLSITALSVTF
ncbi:hypothetical protein [Burkholderia sp. Bp8963]|uniref:hypothetical protein n=1 Tax=Burkholderia sp. Bp8963 TaxID=2184547 RepID=UPI000F5977F2|nr:hypothetical protein [Burkholderia sp. Bp8963]